MGKLTELLLHPDELKAAIQLSKYRKPLFPRNLLKESASTKRCYELLYITSRSFKAVIEELHTELKDVVMVFYLLLRALDTVEDDMTLDPKIKVPWLKSFTDLLKLKEYSFDKVNEKEVDRVTLLEFTEILTEFHKLKPAYQDIITDICKRMGDGMAKYILDEQFNVSGVATLEDYDLYCYYVAGIVGEGLTKLFVEAQFGDEVLSENNYSKAISMGLFLQKTNITRDFREDLDDGRSFWPKEVWSKYTDRLPDFTRTDSPEYQKKGVQCINELVLNALGHVEDVLVYLSHVKDPSSFNFCAIPQVMAVATLELVYNNPNVLYENVKIRRGTTCKLILNSRTYPGVVNIFRHYLRKIHHRSNVEDPHYFEIGLKIGKLEQICDMLYPDPKLIPPGVTVTNSYRELAVSRSQIDAATQEVIDLEAFKCNLTVGAVVVVLAAIVYTCVSSL
ncbi:bifunctional farnesyl-diphosphate farnesyltransferase/squalene synthase [Yamadazyma tenuis]|uniref:Squalene synthase n=1 Tax=Candida tenuis (strain ATCC 10573 / BCRC 21748 / CBS 615 / JCM 9827 / NBRC 10315 / NRRL Y-1498 / VKM Y-70) TaxID=590646 RepID=G3AWA4_CANTC|nr:squalene synthetase [Yamadazyma tenuis ATCC 10573]XP_006684036.1 uncharacterized protein CANTEDRAFT_112210 [Yamadazyma tenuis ATCC 10573]EGV66777.1 squalene synthetase [Yamadazyma tenuis ATCC 10573]EGV66778.1 hypothetical protein CANTEDRAFT_112210 [Yamadazyma tenuis ATCC 10573]WEJ95390.1 bifunctional farnesyl-diphosphate farnesyltransferase/squalene synthase [Yamadazyma tenuis]